MNSRNYRFSYLFTALGFLLLVQPFVHQRPFAAEVVNISFSVMLLTAIYAVAQARRTLIIAATLGITVLLLHWLRYFHVPLFDPTLTAVSAILFLAYCTYLLLSNFFQHQKISSDTLCGAVAVYLMLGVLWSFIYLLVALCNSSAFSINISADRQFTDFIYFSFVTLSTLGFGDITPVTMPARTVTYLEAIAGQIYLAVIIAKLIGIHLSNASYEKKGEKN